MKRVLITGANRGIRKATAEKFLAEGWEVVGTSTKGTGFAHEHISWFKLDLTDAESIAAAVAAVKAGGPVDVLIDNAGIWDEDEEREGTTVSMPVLRKILEVNLIGTIDFTERMLADHLVREGGRILFTGSMSGVISGEKVGDLVPAYKISKVGLGMFSRTLATRLEPSHITVAILDPGWVKTDMGGEEAPRAPEEPAKEFFDLATAEIPTGQFWREGQVRNW